MDCSAIVFYDPILEIYKLMDRILKRELTESSTKPKISIVQKLPR